MQNHLTEERWKKSYEWLKPIQILSKKLIFFFNVGPEIIKFLFPPCFLQWICSRVTLLKVSKNEILLIVSLAPVDVYQRNWSSCPAYRVHSNNRQLVTSVHQLTTHFHTTSIPSWNALTHASTHLSIQAHTVISCRICTETSHTKFMKQKVTLVVWRSKRTPFNWHNCQLIDLHLLRQFFNADTLILTWWRKQPTSDVRGKCWKEQAKKVTTR